jgi:hypothetical protein
MVSDDLTSLAAISMGALASVAVTLSLTAREVPSTVAPTASAMHVVACTEPQRPVVDFAIIRGSVETMVGPERPATGLDPDRVELLLRTR